MLLFAALLFAGCGNGGGGSTTGGSADCLNSATTAVLSWAPPATNADGTPAYDLAGYIIHYGTSSGSYLQRLVVGNTTSYEVSGLKTGESYYFSVTAYDTSLNESNYSNEVCIRLQQ